MEDLTGKQFGQYHVVAPLGEGGMAAVYKAYQPVMERHVAIKVLPRHMTSSAEFLNRFRREARLVAQLQHPHILPVFDYGEEGGYPYIVMPYVVSGTLADILHSRRLSLSEVRRIMTQVGDALGYAHARNIAHRDIKPSNVLLDERGNCLLTDFGLARMAESATKLTASGAIMGTPAYMSPEQATGSTIDARSDIYSLGIILYEMVTGRVPYIAETPVAVVFKHIQDPLPSVHKFNPGVPDSVELILLKALAKSPEDRYQTAEQFVRAIQMAIPDTALDDLAHAEMTTLPISRLPPQKVQPFKKSILPGGILMLTGLLALGILWFGGRFMAERSPGQPGPSPIVPAASIPPAAITDTPAQPSMPATTTVLVSNQSLDFLEEVQVLSTDSFDDPLGSGWSMDTGRIQNGVMEIIGDENWDHGVSRNREIGEYQGVVIDFNYATDSLFEVFVNNGVWDTDEYKRFGVYIGSNNVQTNKYAGRNDLGGADVAGNLTLRPGANYSLAIAILPNGELLEAIWNPSNPSERFFYREKLDETWAGLTWTFWIGVNQGTVQFDNFKQIKFSSAR
jgi:serine/threonine protein kinase